MTLEQRENWEKTYQWAIQKASHIATVTVLNVAVSQLDKENKADFLDSAAAGLRSAVTDSLITANDVKFLLQTWTPDKTHWNALAEAFYKEWASNPPKSLEEARARLEAYARGLQEAAAEARE